ncbi:L,D-transpeptidase family protein [Clostridium tagluense]|uniref:L,D-transpeptidase family protein n=2 Tax=Clostridium tagluense TaxID=360422 RepID=UPI001C0D39E1|nr:L,D-transpeptidase family protein [Clostridium tagluense]MBU3128522.1 L,D-transpeptidase family protein [Clostridium tagluense]MCB2310402.1 L,D-transpeptidase family protein [Clostridium tagluense]MCB2315432.1 L,D-transpeptidase family protein [Clostridium tagluense]MCB2320285.1 L,D-transpeptidase family protein [Clostridium tagluense]MCB2325174.1 L,D-transpeptidase family protein [Clostridium tagluense]
MRKRKVFYVLIILLVMTFPFLYYKYMWESKDLPCIIDTAKRDFIDFPKKENEYKIYPLTKEFTNSISKNKMYDIKEKNIEQKIAGKPIEVSPVNTVLKLYDSGDNVKYIQNRLVEYGYKIKVDGLFKGITHDAILNFQYRCRLDIDGEVGAKTLEKLNIPVAENIEFNTIKPVFSVNKNSTASIALKNYKSISQLESSINSLNATSDTNYYIQVDLHHQRVNIFTKSNEKWILDKSFLCSSGKSSTPTVKGNFTIKDKGPMFRANSNTICNYYTQFYGNYLFHTVLLDNNENIQDGRLGTPLSHGCIRLAIDDAKYIYTSIPYGTSVSIK